MSELRLNNCILLHVPKALTGSLDIKRIAKEFVSLSLKGNTILEYSMIKSYIGYFNITVISYPCQPPPSPHNNSPHMPMQ